MGAGDAQKRLLVEVGRATQRNSKCVGGSGGTPEHMIGGGGVGVNVSMRGSSSTSFICSKYSR